MLQLLTAKEFLLALDRVGSVKGKEQGREMRSAAAYRREKRHMLWIPPTASEMQSSYSELNQTTTATGTSYKRFNEQNKFEQVFRQICALNGFSCVRFFLLGVVLDVFIPA